MGRLFVSFGGSIRRLFLAEVQFGKPREINPEAILELIKTFDDPFYIIRSDSVSGEETLNRFSREVCKVDFVEKEMGYSKFYPRLDFLLEVSNSPDNLKALLYVPVYREHELYPQFGS